MKKKILSQLMILSFAFAGLFLVGNNLMADTPPPETEEHDEHDGEQGGQGGITCAGPDKDWGNCLWCSRSYVYMPTQGWGWGYECLFSGSAEDYCESSCPGWMSN
jgi:hypothetical protein